MNNIIFATDPHEALEKIYRLNGPDYGPVILTQVHEIIWTYEIDEQIRQAVER